MKEILKFSGFEVFSDADCFVKAGNVDSEKVKFDFTWKPIITGNEKIEIRLSVPCIDIICSWYPTCIMTRELNLCGFETSAAFSAPLTAMCNSKGNSVFALAVSDSVRYLKYNLCINERTANMDLAITIDLQQFGKERDYSVTLYTQMDEKPFWKMCENVSDWWDKLYNLKRLPAPKEVYMPCYSSWYAFHHKFTADEIISEAKKAKECGMDLFILDDGWNTDDTLTAAKYAGDWIVSAKKIPDMRKLSDEMHKIGMKFMLWFSVSFLGKACNSWKDFYDKTMDESEIFQSGILDPRYPEVREYIISAYERALIEWNIDGFKLDFIDLFKMHRSSEFKEGMDIFSVEEAVERLLTDACRRMRKIKNDVIIEFRQSYVGPNLRKYGTMFRAVDCPVHYRQNRVSIVDLRMTCSNTVISSDMLMWNVNDTPERAALQILNVIFSAIQFSMRIDSLTKEQVQMVKFWLGFAREHRKILVESTLKAKEMQNFYPIVYAEDEKECITAIYEIDKIADIDLSKKNFVINASGEDYIYLRATHKAAISYVTYDCMGNEVKNGVCEINCAVKFEVPQSGLIVLK
ncbi:MAG: alpha-galactosidase [Oscillospiraceae bacterium]|nr:alpha-galactosidase [Oscillospiraceae bacterium]